MLRCATHGVLKVCPQCEVSDDEALSEAELLFRIEVFLALASLRQWAMRVRTSDNYIDVRMLGSESLATVAEEGDA